MKRVPCPVVEMRVAIRNAGSNLLAHPEWGENVVFSADHETRSRDISQLINHAVAFTSCGLAFQTVERLGNRIGIKSVAAFQHSCVALVIIPKRLGEN